MRKSLMLYIFVMVLIITLNILNIMFGKCNPVIFGSVSFIIAVVITILSLVIPVDERITELNTLEYGIYPTCAEIVIEGKTAYIYSKRSEMYEMIDKHGIDHVVHVEDLNLFGVGLEKNLTVKPDQKTKTTIYKFIIPSQIIPGGMDINPSPIE